jgi:hypothetical protein
MRWIEANTAKMPSMQIDKKPNTKKLFMWNVSSGTADFLFSISNFILVLGAAAVLIGTIGAIKLASIREAFTDLRISDNERETSNANVRAKELENEAAAARLETEKIKGVVAWRSIKPEVASLLRATLSAKPGSVNLRYTDGDPEALFLAIQISNVLAAAKWQVAPGALKIGNSLIFEFLLPDNGSPDAQTLREAFASANVPFSTQLPQSNTMTGSNISMIRGAPMLIVGSRQPPQFP